MFNTVKNIYINLLEKILSDYYYLLHKKMAKRRYNALVIFLTYNFGILLDFAKPQKYFTQYFHI